MTIHTTMYIALQHDIFVTFPCDDSACAAALAPPPTPDVVIAQPVLIDGPAAVELNVITTDPEASSEHDYFLNRSAPQFGN